jgi:hypothetical protein
MKHISAINSYLPPFLMFPRIDKKESIQLSINRIIATIVNSSINDFSEMLKTLSEVKTTKHNPNKLDAAFKI